MTILFINPLNLFNSRTKKSIVAKKILCLNNNDVILHKYLYQLSNPD